MHSCYCCYVKCGLEIPVAKVTELYSALQVGWDSEG